MAEWDVVKSDPAQTPAAPAPKASEWDAVKTADSGPSLVSRGIAPIKNIPGEVAGEFKEGLKNTNEAGHEMFGTTKENKNPFDMSSELKMIGGAAQQLFSPVTGAAKALVGNPLGNVTENVTGNKMAGDFMRNLGTEAASFAGPSALGKLVTKGIDALPTFSKAAQKLIDAGVEVTPGMLYQGLVRNLEEWGQKMPGLKSLVQNGQRSSLESFNKVIIDKALEPVGARLPKGVTGREAISWAENRIGSEYDKLLPKLSFGIDSEFLNDTAAIRNKALTLPEEKQKQLAAIGNDFTARLNASGGMTGRLYKTVDSEMSAKARDYLKTDDPDKRALGHLITDFRGAMLDQLERTNPNYADRLRDINSSYAAFMRAADASMLRAGSGGVFSPNDLLQTVKRSSTKGAFRRGDGLFQDIAEAAAEVLPAEVPKSLGLVGHGAITGLLGGALHFEPMVAAAIGAGSLPYTKPGLSAINTFARRTPGTMGPALNSISQTGPAAAGVAAIPEGYSPHQIQSFEGGATRKPGRPPHVGGGPNVSDAADYITSDDSSATS